MTLKILDNFKLLFFCPPLLQHVHVRFGVRWVRNEPERRRRVLSQIFLDGGFGPRVLVLKVSHVHDAPVHHHFPGGVRRSGAHRKGVLHPMQHGVCRFQGPLHPPLVGRKAFARPVQVGKLHRVRLDAGLHQLPHRLVAVGQDGTPHVHRIVPVPHLEVAHRSGCIAVHVCAVLVKRCARKPVGSFR